MKRAGKVCEDSQDLKSPGLPKFMEQTLVDILVVLVVFSTNFWPFAPRKFRSFEKCEYNSPERLQNGVNKLVAEVELQLVRLRNVLFGIS